MRVHEQEGMVQQQCISHYIYIIIYITIYIYNYIYIYINIYRLDIYIIHEPNEHWQSTTDRGYQ